MRDARMAVRSDAKASGMVTSHTTRYTERWQGSKASDFTSECVSYKLDSEGNKIEGKVFHGKRKAISVQRAQRRMLNKQAAIRAHLLDIAGNNSDAD
jgi:hypothetical protein